MQFEFNELRLNECPRANQQNVLLIISSTSTVTMETRASFYFFQFLLVLTLFRPCSGGCVSDYHSVVNI